MMTNESNSNDLQTILTQAITEMQREQGDKFDLSRINIAELERKTGLSRAKLRRLKKNNFIVTPHGRNGIKASGSVLSGYTDILDALLRDGITNSSVLYRKIRDAGYTGGLTSVKTYISSHKHLVPAKRELVSPQGNRGRRYSTEPGECYQMDWGFINVESSSGTTYKAACFAMICHHCGKRYVEFFPNAKQKNLFIGLLHSFAYLGVPEYNSQIT